MGVASTITPTIAALAAFLIFLTALKYAIADEFVRTRAIMTSFFLFIVFTLTLAFWPYTLASLPYTIPAAGIGIALGYFVAVKAAQERLLVEGVEHYLEHAMHVRLADLTALRWWSVINVYSIMGALLLINLVGLSTVWFVGRQSWAIATCAFGALLLGSIVPYLVHLWSLKRKVPQSRA